MKLDFHYLFSAKYAKWIILSLIALFSCLILYEFASLFSNKTNSAALNPSATALPAASKQDSVNHVLNSSLFGVYVPDDLNDSSLQKSSLNLTLVGILLADKEDDSQVIIRSARGEEKTYKLEDTIPGGALIKRISAGGVVVEQNGTLESLSLPKNDLTFEPIAKPMSEE